MSTWILLRGLTRDARHWDGFGALLQATLGAEQVLTPDLPGNGRCWRERSPIAVHGYVDSLRARLRQAGAAPPYHLFALSLGAMVALAWAQQHPDELAGAVLVNTSLRPFSPAHHRLRPGSWPRLLRLAIAPASDARWEQAVLQLTTRRGNSADRAGHGEAAADAEVLQRLARWTAWRAATPVSRANALRQLLAAARFSAPRQPPAVPLLLLASRQDRLVDPRCSERLAAAWQCPIAWHPSAGHDLPLDEAAWTVAAVKRWLDEAPASGSLG